MVRVGCINFTNSGSVLSHETALSAPRDLLALLESRRFVASTTYRWMSFDLIRFDLIFGQAAKELSWVSTRRVSRFPITHGMSRDEHFNHLMYDNLDLEYSENVGQR